MSEDKALFTLLATVMYVGERCRYCGHEFTTVDDLRHRQFVWARRKEEGEPIGKGQIIACKACFEERHGHDES